MLGACTASELARRGGRVTFIDRAPDVMQGASRWNEGSTTLATLSGGTRRSTPGATDTGRAGIQGSHRTVDGDVRSRIGYEEDLDLYIENPLWIETRTAGYIDAWLMRMVDDAARGRGARYLGVDVKTARVHHLSPSELAQATCRTTSSPAFAFRADSVSPVPVADAIAAAVRAEPLIEIRAGVDVRAVCHLMTGSM